MLDFTFCQVDKTANYGGSDKKRGIFYNDARYMLNCSNHSASGRTSEMIGTVPILIARFLSI